MLRGMKWLGLILLFACGAPAPKVEAPPAAPPVVAPATDPLTPLDPSIKIGHLANGLTYYVMKHGKPETRASLWLAVNAGSVLEDDDQRGLAHFTEHMAFNGTKRFPKQDIVNYIEKVGMDFGADVNAATSFDDTTYQLTVPTDQHDVLMKGLDILRDWAGDISFDPVEIDKERGVVLEEWRLGRGASARLQDKEFPVLFAGSKYADRIPIGLPETLKTAKRDQLYRFYKDWYRPDNMAVIAVGDFDPAEIEQEIKKKFGDLANPVKERARVSVPVPRDKPTAATVATDAEMPITTVTISDKLAHRRETTRSDFRRLIVETVYHSMLNARFAELALEPDAAFTVAGSATGSMVRSTDMFQRQAQAKEGHVKQALAALVTEVARVEKYGFVKTELERAQRSVIADYEKEANEWDKVPDSDLCDEITRNFYEAEQMGGRVAELQMVREMVPTFTLEELNGLAKQWGGEQGRVIAMAGPTSTTLPSEAEVVQIYATASKAAVEPWKDDGADKPLIATKPTPGTITAETHDAVLDATVWTLSNGARVVVKPTTFQNDEIMFDGWQKGGTSILSDADYAQVRWQGLISGMGVGEFSQTQLEKVLSGHVVEVGTGYTELATSVSGSTRPADLETMLQLAYLRMTAPRNDPREFQTWKADQLEWVRHRAVMPEQQFWEQLATLQTGNHPRYRPLTVEMLNAVDPTKALKIFGREFANFSGFTFSFVGNIDPKVLKPLVETYLAGLPGANQKPMWKDIGVNWAKGPITKLVVAGTEPKSNVAITETAPDKWSLELERDAVILSKILEIRLREVMREDMGGVYGVSVAAAIVREPKQRREFEISFTCDPDNVDKLEAAALDEIAKISKDGIGDEYLAKVKEQLRREHEVNLKENQWWVGEIHNAYWYGDDFNAASDVNAMLARATSDNVKASAKRFFDPKHLVIGVMKPKSAPAKPVK
jgi:zinc protease